MNNSPDSQRPRGPVRTTVDKEEAHLVRRAMTGDRDAFGKLVEKYAGPVRRLCRAILRNPDDADDAAQEAFLNAWVKLATYNPKRPLRSWMMRIAANSATDRWRRRTLRETETLPDSVPSEASSPERETERKLLDERLREELDELPVRYRMAVVLFDVEGYSHAEISRILGIPEGTVRSDVFHARRMLRQALSDWKDTEA